MNIPTLKEWHDQKEADSLHLKRMAEHIAELAHRENRGLFRVKGKFEHHAEYTAGYMQAERRGELVGVYSRKATVEDVLEDMRCEMSL